jgi:nickel-dependent lactate racemase
LVDLFCGDWRSSHRSACDSFAARNTVEITEKRDLVIASCGGYPHDINMIQAHKTLDAASRACTDGGTIILISECRDGLGRPDFLKWFEADNSTDLANRLCEKYQVNGQTGWSLLKKAERFRIEMITNLDPQELAPMRITKMDSLPVTAAGSGYILPDGAKVSVRQKKILT